MVPRDGQISRWGNPGPEKLSDLTKDTRCIRGQSAGVAWQQPQLSLRIPNLSLLPGPPPSGKGFTYLLSTNNLIPHVGATGVGDTRTLEQVSLARAHTCPAPFLSSSFPSLPIPHPLRGGGKPEELELDVSQWADGPRTRPPPSLLCCPIEIYYNVVATRGGGVRAGGLAAGRAGLALRREGGRVRARAPRSLTPSLPPPVC